tara:strand:+ start:2329 stop:2571 length:243 start_codon:yes stop_codon:yes gene_type:complete
MKKSKLPLDYMCCLFEKGEGDRKVIANLLLKDIYFNKGKLSNKIVKEIGDETYNKETFLKAADLLIKEVILNKVNSYNKI